MQELPIAAANVAGAINSYEVGVMGQNLQHYTRLCPSGRATPSLVLHIHVITHMERAEGCSAFTE